ncbi:MAG: choice-of-anchor tandem repeat GloVer-containing protein [Chthoniobacterales bacterium]
MRMTICGGSRVARTRAADNRAWWRMILVVLVAGVSGLTCARGSVTDVIYSFGGDEDGEYADTDLAIDGAGNIYGTSVLGGDFGSGTVFQVSPVAGGWVHTVLYDFMGGADGAEPYKGVTLDSQGNLYGTAVTGGSGSCEGGCGVAYKLSNSGGTWTQTVLHAFTGGTDGSGPGARMAIDAAGNLYGMTPTGGADGLGTIYQLHPLSSGGYEFKVIHTFTGGTDGASGSAGLMLLRGKKLYGVATTGGTYGAGTAFQLTPSRTGEWGFVTLYSFRGQPDGGFPYGGLLFDATGNLYGTTYYDGANDLGCVYELSPAVTGEWTEQVLYSFKAEKDGSGSISNLVVDAQGNLYGTTSEGGLGPGTIFRLSLRPDGSWKETLSHLFSGPPDGAYPYAGMTPGRSGTFFGATVHGGDGDDGAIYQFTP